MPALTGAGHDAAARHPAPGTAAGRAPGTNAQARWAWTGHTGAGPTAAAPTVAAHVVAARAGAALAGMVPAGASAAGTSATVDGTKPGPAFDGVGAISAGGANSRLLIDYPEPERSQILDYLFQPGYGASLQMLKIEIGGDSNSTDGAEPSHEHTEGSVDCNGGYEWWIAQQAVARNPDIKLYALQWAAPAWTGTWTQNDVNYLLDWMGCARSHGLTINYLGGWNERNYLGGGQWFINLRSALDTAGYTSTQIVAADGSSVGNVNAAMNGSTPGTVQPYYYNANDPWQIAGDMAANPQLKNAVAVVGGHDTCGYPTTGYGCYTTPTARSIGRPLWESELGDMDGNTGAAAMARSINTAYNQAGITGFLEWPLLDAMPPGLNYASDGLVTADQPWSGYYTVNRMTWAIAQTTQFVQPGWRHVGGANSWLAGGGSYDTYQAPDHSAWSMVAETTEAPSSQQSQTVTVHVTGGLPAGTVHVWATNIWSTNPADYMVQEPDVRPFDGAFNYTIPPGYIVTFTTTGAGGGASPDAAASPPPYVMHQASGLLPEQRGTAGDGSGEPALLSPQDGAYEYAPCGDGTGEDCVQQTASGGPTRWIDGEGSPYALLGDDWSGAYTVAGEMMFTGNDPWQAGGLIGRFSGSWDGGELFRAYELVLRRDGAWWLWKNDPCRCTGTLATGHAAAAPAGTWHRLSLTMNGYTITMSINGHLVGRVTDRDPNFTHGAAGIMTGGWYDVSYRNLSISW